MATGRGMQLTKQFGEYSVCAELCRRGFIATTFTGNVPEFDILAINDKRENKHIQVKAIKSSSWQFDAGKFLDISFSSNGIQTINGKKPIQDPNLICVFVKLVSQGKDEFYILRFEELQDIIYKNHRSCLSKYQGRRPRKPNSMHTAVSPENLSKYRDNWERLKD
ncbi:MAG: hypothetical protein HYX79_02400 [Chloroflexi bacterium]|nr:hypothetical protein [Chloroflexota bacterium]